MLEQMIQEEYQGGDAELQRVLDQTCYETIERIRPSLIDVIRQFVDEGLSFAELALIFERQGVSSMLTLVALGAATHYHRLKAQQPPPG